MLELLTQYMPNQYLRAAIILVISLFTLKIGISLGRKIIIKVTKKTKTKIDDIIVEKSSRPVTLLAFFISLKITLVQLSLSEGVRTFANRTVDTGVYVLIVYLIFIILDVMIEHGWKNLAKKTKTRIDDSLISLADNTLKVAFAVIVALMVLDIWGFQIGPLLAGLGIAGLAVALALQPTLGNVFSGAAIIIDKSIGIGDVVSLPNGKEGKIEKIGLRSTKVKTFDNELIIIPNTMLADSQIENVALPEPKTRVVVPFGVAYGTDVGKVKKLAIKELKKISHVTKEPAPFVRFIEMGDSALNFKAYFYIDSYEYRLSARDEANTRIYNTLNKNKIEIPYPQMDVHLKK